MNALLPLALGVLFGVLLQRAGATRYERILGMLRLRDLTILKFMLLAIGVAAVGVAALSFFGVGHLSIKPLYVAGVLLGGAVFGVGFALAGYCPGTGLVACAEGRKDAWFAVGGGFLGALAYTLVHPLVEPVLQRPLNLGKVTFASALGLSGGVAGLLFGAGFISLALLLPRTPGRRVAGGPPSPGAELCPPQP